jgi:hypothetical protein
VPAIGRAEHLAFAGQAAVDTASTRHFRQDEIEDLHVANAQLKILWAGTPEWVRFPPPVLDLWQFSGGADKLNLLQFCSVCAARIGVALHEP